MLVWSIEFEIKQPFHLHFKENHNKKVCPSLTLSLLLINKLLTLKQLQTYIDVFYKE